MEAKQIIRAVVRKQEKKKINSHRPAMQKAQRSLSDLNSKHSRLEHKTTSLGARDENGPRRQYRCRADAKPVRWLIGGRRAGKGCVRVGGTHSGPELPSSLGLGFPFHKECWLGE